MRRLPGEFGEFIESHPLKRTTVPYLDGIWTWIDCNPRQQERISRVDSQESIAESDDMFDDYYSRRTVKQLSQKTQDKINRQNGCFLRHGGSAQDVADLGSNSFDSIVILHGISGTAGEYFMLIKSLLDCGYRVISAQYPLYDDIGDWVRSFSLFLDQLGLESVHLYGSDLGGYLGIIFSQEFPSKVKSLILCNAFVSTLNLLLPSIASTFLYFCPKFILVKLISEIFRNKEILYSPIEDLGLDSAVSSGISQVHERLYRQSLDFVTEQLYSLSSSDLASRLSFILSGDETSSILNLSRFSSLLQEKRITFIYSPDNSFDDHLLLNSITKFENVKLAQLKYGGDFPHLSNPDDVALFCKVHLRNCNAKGLVPPPSSKLNKQESIAKLPSPPTSCPLSSNHYDMPYPGNIIHHESSFEYNSIN
ncbi:hypothetical protein OIY81_2501 [Cryptosporidium canis]|nr:hypothetical protein OIY81_2501 [Cryptosporidium canis]